MNYDNNNANYPMITFLPNYIYIYILSEYLTDQDHVYLCCTNQYSYAYWSQKINLKQTYNEQTLIHVEYRSSIFRSQVRYIACTDIFNEILTTDDFTETFITHLTFGNRYNQPTYNLPLSITHLTFDWMYNQPTNHLSPFGSITHLTFGFSYNQTTNHLPLTITHLTFGLFYNQPTDHLPSSITHLKFDWMYNQPTNDLPHSITHLTFGGLFNQPLDFVLSFGSIINIYLHEIYRSRNHPLLPSSSLVHVSFYS
jgi:hypothetical protein